MKYKIEVGEKEQGEISYEVLPVFQYFLREMGLDVIQNPSRQCVELTSVLTRKNIVLSAEDQTMPQTFRKHHLEKEVLKQVQKFLQASGAEVNVINQKKQSETIDLHLMFSLLEVPNIKEPLLELSSFSKVNFQKLVEVFQVECRNRQMRFKLNDRSGDYDPATIKIQIFSPVVSNDEFWNRYGETYAMTITSGIFAKFLGGSPLAAFSLIPIENLLSLFTIESSQKSLPPPTNKGEANPIERPVTKNTSKMSTDENKIKGAAAFFDYHLLIDDEENKKIQVHGNLHIKNTGTEALRNPVICIKASPSEGIKITGQILPKDFAQTKGVLNQEGAKGWRYLNENWFEEFEEKGEIWICPIQSILIQPRQTETLPNLQIQILDPQQDTVRVEAYVFMNEDELEFKASNRISLSLLKKIETNGG